MARILYVCPRDPSCLSDFPDRAAVLNRRISPQNITPNPVRILHEHGVWAAIFNPTTEMLVHGASVCSGFPIFVPENWWMPRGPDPDGAYALFRSDENFVDLGTDVVASRTIWYAQTDDFFIASSSQRAIIAFLGDFQPNRSVYTHMLASGLLGPNFSWDARIRYVTPEQHLLFDRSAWSLSLKRSYFALQPNELLNREAHKAQLNSCLEEVFSLIKFDPNQWLLTLSGGVDSRAILSFLNETDGLKSVTWGPKGSLENPASDPAVARQVADSFRIENEFIEFEPAGPEDARLILDRFIEAGEGRIDQIAGYLDGMRVWKTIFEKGYTGIIRGDELLGISPILSRENVFSNMNYIELSNFKNLPPAQDFDLEVQHLPREYNQRPGESLTAWAFRIYRNFEIPVELSPLNEIKAGYVEVMNPLLSRKLTNVIKQIPYQYNVGKSLLKEIMREKMPKINFSSTHSQSLEEIVGNPAFKRVILEELRGEYARSLLPQKFLDYLFAHIHTAPVAARQPAHASLARKGKKFVKEYLPWMITLAKRATRTKVEIDYNLLAYRSYIIVRSTQMLESDARVFAAQAAADRVSSKEE